jgi:murein DD-endopeptidase MepM/ murein hydrolase activator NlpD
MKRYLSHSLLAICVIVLIGLVVRFNTKSSVAHANLQNNAPLHPLAEVADSLRDVSLQLDGRIAELRREDMKLRSRLALPYASKELQEVAKEVISHDATKLSAPRPDAFELSTRIEQQVSYMESLDSTLEDAREVADHLPTLTPSIGVRSSGFGPRIHPITQEEKMHKGLDIAATTGTPIHVTGDGVVVKSGVATGYGNVVVVDHGYGYRTLYAHASELIAKTGDKVKRGDVIALVGSTGGSTGPHLHYEVLVDGEHVDPRGFLMEPLKKKGAVGKSIVNKIIARR